MAASVPAVYLYGEPRRAVDDRLVHACGGAMRVDINVLRRWARRLRTACAMIALNSPAAILNQRATLEALRSLLQGSLGVAEIGYAPGFEDTAYFNCYFNRRAGVSPAGFRKNAGVAGDRNDS